MAAPDPHRPLARLPDDRVLARLHADTVSARSVLDTTRRGSNRSLGGSRAAEARLLGCLESFASALAARHLPVPRGLRDELRLRRLISSERP